MKWLLAAVMLMGAHSAHAADATALGDDDLLRAAKICYDFQIQNGGAYPDQTTASQCKPVLTEHNARVQAKAKAAAKPKVDELNEILKK